MPRQIYYPPRTNVAHTFKHFSFKHVQEFFQSKNLENQKTPNKTNKKQQLQKI